MILNAEDDFYPRGLLPSPTPPPSNYCTGWILPPHNAAVDVAAQAESRRLLHEDDKGEQCLQQSWRWAAVWGTIARQHVFGAQRQFTPPGDSCDPATCRQACCDDPVCVEWILSSGWIDGLGHGKPCPAGLCPWNCSDTAPCCWLRDLPHDPRLKLQPATGKLAGIVASGQRSGMPASESSTSSTTAAK